jgi:hypothetical protein
MTMEEKKVFEEPEVTSYDRDELDLQISQTGEQSARVSEYQP